MKEHYKYILENTSKGKIEKQVAIEILTMLKTIEREKNLELVKVSTEDIAVIGMAVKLPMADSVEEFWYNLRNGLDCISLFPANRRGDTDIAVKAMYSSLENVQYDTGAFLNEIDKFDYSFFKLSPKEASLMDPNQRLLLQTTVNAIENAGYGGSKITGTRTGVYVGYSSDFGESYKTYAQWLENSFTGFTLTGNIKSILAGRISYSLDLKGPSMVVDTACSSALVAVHLACQELRTGKCDMAVAGGVKINLLPLKTDSSQRIGIESPTGRVRTFDDSSDGTGFGEGVAVVFLKPLNKAINDGDVIHAVIKGTAVNQDGSSSGITAPNSAAQEDVILNAWKDAGIEPETITYIEAHGTGTRLGDPIEVEGIRRAFEKHTQKKQFCGIGSVKTNIGHLDNAAGIAGLIKVILALKNRQLPPTLYFARPNRHISFENSPVYICDRLRRWEANGVPRRCGVSSFGLSGTNCHVVIEEAPSVDEKGSMAAKNDVLYVLTLSAMSERVLKTLVGQYRDYLKGCVLASEGFLKNICFTTSTGRGHYTFRLALIIRNYGELIGRLDKVLASDIRGYENEGIYYGWYRIAANPAQTNGYISMNEIRQISDQANRKTKDFVKSGRCKKDIISQICRLYIKGADIQWEMFFEGTNCKRTELPGYPFERKRCWLKLPEGNIPDIVNDKKRAPSEKFNTERKKNYIAVKIKGRENGSYSETEKRLADIWGSMLDIDEIDISDKFYDIGGNSILAIRMEVELEKIGMSADALYIDNYPTLAEFAAFLDRKSDGKKVDNNKIETSSEISPLLHTSDCSPEQPSVETIVPNQIILEGIEPFNDVYYKSCFYNSLFPIVKYLGKDVSTFLVNQIIAYNYDDNLKTIPLSASYRSIKDDSTILDEIGIFARTKEVSNDIIHDITSSISEGRPAILWVDSYYEPIRDDTFQKKHLVHTWLVFGFNDTKRECHIIEHRHSDSLVYEKYVLGYDDVINSYEGFIDNLQSSMVEIPSYSDYSNSKKESSRKKNGQVNHLHVFRENYLRYRDTVLEGLEGIKLFQKLYAMIIADENTLSENVVPLIDCLNEVIKIKKVESCRARMVLNTKPDYARLVGEITDYWDFVRKQLARYMYTSAYKPENLTAIVKVIDTIYNLEHNYHKMLSKDFMIK